MNKLMFNDDEKSGYGDFSSLDFDLKLELQAIDANWENGEMPVNVPGGRNRPAFEVFGAGRGGPVKLGVAWVHSIKRGDNAGQKMIGLSLDDPSFPVALNLTAFPTQKRGEFDLKWERPRRADNAA